MAGNGSKPYQLAQIVRSGFRVPGYHRHDRSGRSFAPFGRTTDRYLQVGKLVRSRVSRLTPEHLERFGDVASCPTQFQRCIAGTDYRVHVVGAKIFACEVQSEADDYRYPGPHEVSFSSCSVPSEVEDRCRRLAAAMNLFVAGIDLRRSYLDDAWYCFEVNPSPGFTYYEEATGLPIGNAVARLLAAGADGV